MDGGRGFGVYRGGCYISCGGIVRVCGFAAFRIVSYRIILEGLLWMWCFVGVDVLVGAMSVVQYRVEAHYSYILT